MDKLIFVGLNVQYPISQLILSGEKSIETRTYPLPSDYVGREMLLIETPGKSRKFKARIIAKIIFGQSYKYLSKKDFSEDMGKHRVDSRSPWKWVVGKPKWAWPIMRVEPLPRSIPAPAKRGIIFTKSISLVGKSSSRSLR